MPMEIQVMALDRHTNVAGIKHVEKTSLNQKKTYLLSIVLVT